VFFAVKIGQNFLVEFELLNQPLAVSETARSAAS